MQGNVTAFLIYTVMMVRVGRGYENEKIIPNTNIYPAYFTWTGQHYKKRRSEFCK
jgi:hypothetical protein